MTKVQQMVQPRISKRSAALCCPADNVRKCPDVVNKQSKGIGRTIHWHTFYFLSWQLLIA